MAGFFDNWGMGGRVAQNPWGTPPYFPVGELGMGGGFESMGGWGTTPLPSTVPVGSPTMPTGGIPSIARTAPKLGLNFDTANLALTGLSTIGNLWAAFQAQKLAKKQFEFTRDFSVKNLNNQTQTYNTALTDRANNRAIVEGRDAAYTKNYIDANSLSRYGK